jgi:UDP-N-acetylglucosamine--N-acetylmuramyl-(pentapeptide) pyrophosphoryl-undecaprenol N-acetylglucosamine transferase
MKRLLRSRRAAVGERSKLPRGGRLLIAASTGGHLQQAKLLAKALSVDPDSSWVTFRNSQSKALLDGQRVTYVPYISPRDVWQSVRALLPIIRAVRSARPDAVVSTGAAIAPLAAIACVVTRTPFFYIESIARTQGPSLSGRILTFFPQAHLFTQHPTWASERWHYDVSVLDALESAGTLERRVRLSAATEPIRIFVTLGTIRPYRFDALINNVTEIIGDGYTVRWQLGVTARQDLPGLVATEISNEDMVAWMEWCDVLITHAGVGTVLQALELGKRPVVVPRRSARREHVDDHQELIAALLSERGLAIVREAGNLTSDDVARL